MKTIIALSTFALTKALDQDSEIFKAQCEIKWNEFDEKVEAGEVSDESKDRMEAALKELCPGFRMSSDAQFHVGNLESYGCWCRFDRDSHGKGKGPTADVYDGFCKLYHDAVTCLAMDYGSQCNPWDVTYSFTVLQDDKTVDCETLNDNDCAINLCKIESHLVYNVLNEATSLYGNPLQHSAYNKNHNQYPSTSWTYDECKVGNGGSGPAVLECCGQYHIRYPFKTSGASTSKQCCDKNDGSFGTSTFNPISSECCDGNVMPLGTNC